jgi:DNA-binding transcriptional LysR family regulator
VVVELRDVDLNLLVAFDALMAERSVTRAAHRLCIGQSAMSSTLTRLRKLFDDPLLIRDGRELVATPYAESLVKPVSEVLDGVAAILAGRTEFDPTRAERTFAVTASDYTMITFITPLLAQLEQEAPGVRLWVSPPGDDYEVRLRRGQLDLLLIPREVLVSYRDFPHQLLFQDRFVCAVDADNDSVGDSISLEEFSLLPYLATSCGHAKRNSTCSASPATPRSPLRSASLHSCCEGPAESPSSTSASHGFCPTRPHFGSSSRRCPYSRSTN